jgi:hypothetical protein
MGCLVMGRIESETFHDGTFCMSTKNKPHPYNIKMFVHILLEHTAQAQTNTIKKKMYKKQEKVNF